MITDPSAVKFCNEVARPTMDRLTGAILDIQNLLSQYGAKGLAATITNTTDLIDDGSAPGGSAPSSPDGRTPITGADVTTMIGGLQAIQAALQANNNALYNNAFKIAVNPQV